MTHFEIAVHSKIRHQLKNVVERIAASEIGPLRMFEAHDAFRLIPALGVVQGATKRVQITAAYETSDGSSVELEFSGTPEEAMPVKEFLDPQFRSVAESSCETVILLTFTGGLALDGDGPDKLTTQLTRFASGAAQVQATAEALPEAAGDTP